MLKNDFFQIYVKNYAFPDFFIFFGILVSACIRGHNTYRRYTPGIYTSQHHCGEYVPPYLLYRLDIPTGHHVAHPIVQLYIAYTHKNTHRVDFYDFFL